MRHNGVSATSNFVRTMACTLLVVTWALAQAAAPPGLLARGRAVVQTPAGPRMGTIEVATWGARRSRVTITFPGGEQYTLVQSNGEFSAQGRGNLLPLLAAQGLHQACDLLPAGLALSDVAAGLAAVEDLPAADTPRRIRVHRLPQGPLSPDAAARLAANSAVILDLDASGNPARASFTLPGRTPRQVATSYSAWQGFASGVQPAHVERRVDGALRLTVDYTAIAPAAFTDADFRVLPSPALSRPGAPAHIRSRPRAADNEAVPRDHRHGPAGRRRIGPRP